MPSKETYRHPKSVRQSMIMGIFLPAALLWRFFFLNFLCFALPEYCSFSCGSTAHCKFFVMIFFFLSQATRVEKWLEVKHPDSSKCLEKGWALWTRNQNHRSIQGSHEISALRNILPLSRKQRQKKELLSLLSFREGISLFFFKKCILKKEKWKKEEIAIEINLRAWEHQHDAT